MERRHPQSLGPILLTILILGAGGAAFIVPSWIQKLRRESDRNAHQVLSFLASAEGDFRSNDRDGNGVKDFWTGDVAGLYKFGLIPREIAEADAAPLVPLVPEPIPYKGILFRALVVDNYTTPPTPYQEDTDGKSGKVHGRVHFGFVAYPSGGLRSPKYMWIINEICTAFSHEATVPPPTEWPPDSILKTWSHVR